MGTVASIDVQRACLRESDVTAITTIFDRLEDRFSLYRDNSELSRVAHGELLLTESSDELRSVYESAIEWRSATSGVFTPHRPDGVLDLDGIVKAIAIQQVGVVLHDRGFDDWCLNVGGDVLTAGSPLESQGWTVGIVDPSDRTALLCAVRLREGHFAIATSGTAERGEHVWRASSESAGRFAQVSVSAGDIITADVLATAILAGGESFRDVATESWDIDVLTVSPSGELSMTPGMQRTLAEPFTEPIG
jgi:thiamine biosynthesis lipoprotein